MSKNITILEDGVQKSFQNVSLITTKAVSGSAISWMPEDEAHNLGIIMVEQNGEYIPSDNGLYAYYLVVAFVSGGNSTYLDFTNTDGTVYKGNYTPTPSGAGEHGGGSIIGTDPSDGNLYYVKVDDDGFVQKVKIPSYGVMDTFPKHTYSDGEILDYTGASLSLYYADGTKATEWDGGEISYGDSHWASHISPYSQPVTYSDGVMQDVPTTVLPFWLDNWEFLPDEYSIKVPTRIVIHLFQGDIIVTDNDEMLVTDEYEKIYAHRSEVEDG